MDERGVITAPGPFQGLDRFEARPAVVAALREQGRIVAEKRPYVHSVGHCSRCDTTVEPRLSLQWFVKVEPLAKAAGDAVRDGRVRDPPGRSWRSATSPGSTTCTTGASRRQLWWGHRIPVWYGPDGEVVCVGPDEQPPTGEGWTPGRRRARHLVLLRRCGRSPRWAGRTTPRTCARFYPTSVLVTGYDILFFWVARMMMFGLYAMDGVQPFDVVALHGMVRDQHGKKMSKSFGNAVDPLDWIDAYGADALRFTLARGANPGADVPISEEWVPGLAATSATSSGTPPGSRCSTAPPTAGAAAAGRASCPPSTAGSCPGWQHVIAEVDARLRGLRVRQGRATSLYHFAWDDVCDWYVELAKPPLAAGGRGRRRPGRVLGHVLDQLLRLLHPVDPVRHRGAVDRADRRRVARGRAPGRRPTGPGVDAGRRGRGRGAAGRGHRGPPVPLRPGAAARPAGRRAARRAWRRPASPRTSR